MKLFIYLFGFNCQFNKKEDGDIFMVDESKDKIEIKFVTFLRL